MLLWLKAFKGQIFSQRSAPPLKDGPKNSFHPKTQNLMGQPPQSSVNIRFARVYDV